MFISKTRSIVVPQSEHQRLAGILAYHWGNEEYSLPDINRGSFLLGVATHDRAFGMLDTLALGNISEEQRVEQVDKWIGEAYDNPEAELVVLLHVRRLLHVPDLMHLYRKIDTRIQELAITHDLDLIDYEKADTVTDLCDFVAFDFSFGEEISRTRAVYKNPATTVQIKYQITEGQIIFDTWPFNTPKITGYILGYEKDEYPQNLQPELMDFEIVYNGRL